MPFHPKADWLKRLIFQLKIFRSEFMEQRPIVDVDESGLALDAPRDRDIVQKDRGARQVKVGMLEAG